MQSDEQSPSQQARDTANRSASSASTKTHYANCFARSAIDRYRSSSLTDGSAPFLSAQLATPLEARLKHCLPDLDFKALADTLDDGQMLELTDKRNHDNVESAADDVAAIVVDGVTIERTGEAMSSDRTRPSCSNIVSRASSDREPQRDSTAVAIQLPQSLNEDQYYRRTFAKENMATMIGESGDSNLNDAYQKIKKDTKSKWHKFRSFLYEYLDFLVVWRSSFKEIEGKHGTQATCYFIVLRWLMIFNLLGAFVILCFLVLPQAFLTSDFLTSRNTSSTGLNQYEEQSLNCTTDYYATLLNRDSLSVSDSVVQFLKGTGWMESTLLFTGHYFNRKLSFSFSSLGYTDHSLFSVESKSYNMPVAFLLVVGFYFLFTFIAMIVYTGDGFRDRNIYRRTRMSEYSLTVFSAWDYNLTATHTAAVNQMNLHQKFMDSITLQREIKARAQLSSWTRCNIYLTRLIINITVMAIWIVAGYLIYGVVSGWTEQMKNWSPTIKEYLPSLTITLLNGAIPTLFYLLAKFERLTSDTQVEITIARSVILRIASLIVLVISLRKEIVDCKTKICGNCAPIKCWETYVGQQFYRLVLMDTFALFVVTAFEFFRRICIDNQKEKYAILRFIPEQNFNLPKNVLDLIYCQTLSWIGGFFCPLIPIITVFKLFIMFYIKKVTILRNCVPYANHNRTSRINSFFMMVLLFSFVFCIAVISYSIGRIPPSQACGPWRVYNQDRYYIYMSASSAVDTLPSFINASIRFLSSWTFYIPMIVFVGFVVAYNTSMISKYKAMIIMLREQNDKVEKDKIYLLEQINKVMKKME